MDTEKLVVTIDVRELIDPEEYTRLPRKKLIADKIRREIKSQAAWGWEIEHIHNTANGAELEFRRASATV